MIRWCLVKILKDYKKDRNVKSSENIKACVYEIISQQLGHSTDSFDNNTSIEEELCADSLDMTELFIELEEEFDVDIPNDAEFKTVGDVCEIIEQLVLENVA